MPPDPNKQHHRSLRLKGYDYSQAGAYFVTMCTKGHECVLDDPTVEGIINAVWDALPKWFPTIELDEFVVMPNHVHLIVWILSPDVVGTSLADVPNADGDNDDVGTSLADVPNSDGDNDVVGTSLADVLDADGIGANWTGASPVPTDGDNDVVGTSLADVPNAGWTGASPVPTDWIIPEPVAINMHPTLGDVMGAFKSLVFTVYLDWIESHSLDRRAKFWQHNYYEHIIRNDRELNAIRQYIIDNPAKWDQDRDNPIHIRPAIDTVAAYLSEAGL